MTDEAPHPDDLAYNPRLRVANVSAIFERWQSQARAARASIPGMLADLRFGDAPAETLDYFPATLPRAPLLIFIHGGYWRAMDKADFSWVAPPFHAAGCAVALINYSLAPAARIETMVEEVRRAHAWLWRNADRLGHHRARMVTSGHSAGGHLCAMTLATRWVDEAPDLPLMLVPAGVAISGLFDLRPCVRAPFLAPTLNLDESRANALSPAFMQPAAQVQLLSAVGGEESEAFKEQDRRIREQWSAHAGPEVPLPGRDHFSACDALAEPDHALFKAALALLRQTPR
jgi:arylformamidase